MTVPSEGCFTASDKILALCVRLQDSGFKTNFMKFSEKYQAQSELNMF